MRGIAYFNLILLVKKNLLEKDETIRVFEIIIDGRRKQQIKFGRYKKKVFQNDFLCLGPTVYNRLPLLTQKQTLLRGEQLG